MTDNVAFETRDVFNPGSYPDIDDSVDATPDADRFTDTSDAVVADLAGVNYNAQASAFLTDMPAHLPSPPTLSKDESLSSSPGASNISKPVRQATRNAEGKFVCEVPDCTAIVKVFARRSEWNKHMDKHDRPYKCGARGCEKLAGFTYSGGLLRHEREVHQKHGGPKTTHDCPHKTCKRSSGNGFSRLENLNEHLRRVHTPNAVAGSPGGGDTDDAVSETRVQKRKRESEDVDPFEEVNRLRLENEQLREQLNGNAHQIVLMLQQINELQEQLARQHVLGIMQPPDAVHPQAMVDASSML